MSASTRWRPAERVRPLAIGWVSRLRAGRPERLLMAVRDDAGRLKGWRPVGGEIEFGETAEAALRREFREELSADLAEVTRLGLIENLFEHEGAQGHELVIVFAARLAAERESYPDLAEGGVVSTIAWVADDLRDAPLFPTGLGALIPAEPGA